MGSTCLGWRPSEPLSRPAGYVRIEIAPSNRVFASTPFAASNPDIHSVLSGQLAFASATNPSDEVLFWNTREQNFGSIRKFRDTWVNEGGITSTLSILPGVGYWLANLQAYTQSVVLAGFAVTNPIVSTSLASNLNALGFPFSSASRDAAYRMGAGFWLNIKQTQTAWNVTSPYTLMMPTNVSHPAIEGVAYSPAKKTVQLFVVSPVHNALDILYKNISATTVVNYANGWTTAATINVNSKTCRIMWEDPVGVASSSDRASFGRLYAVAPVSTSSAANKIIDSSATISSCDINWYYFNHDELSDPMVERVPVIGQPFLRMNQSNSTGTLRILTPLSNTLARGESRIIWLRLSSQKPGERAWTTESYRMKLESNVVISAKKPFHGQPVAGFVTVSVYRVDWRLPNASSNILYWYSPTVCITDTNGVQRDWSILLGAKGFQQTGERYEWNNWSSNPQRHGKNFIGNDYLVGFSPQGFENGGFEGGVGQPGNSLRGWKSAGYSGSLSAQYARDGKCSMRLRNWDEGIWQELCLHPNQEFIFKACMLTPPGSNALSGARYGIVSVDFYDRWERRVGGQKHMITSKDVRGTWRTFVSTNRVPAQTRSVNVSLYMDGSGSGDIYFDALSLTVLADSDGDGLTDEWERLHGLNPKNVTDATGDLDGDGLTNIEERNAGTDPTKTDTDDDGFSDKTETTAGSSPLDASSKPGDPNGVNEGAAISTREIIHRDQDRDGIPDSLERLAGTDPVKENKEVWRAVDFPVPTQTIHRAGSWTETGSSLQSEGKRGSVTYRLAITENGLYRIDAGIQIRDQLADASAIEWYLDDVLLARHNTGSGGRDQLSGVVLPWLTTGVYRITMWWDNSHRDSRMRIDEINLKQLRINGDADRSGQIVSKWIRQEFGTSKTNTSYVSPAVITGTTRYPHLVNIPGCVVQSDDDITWFATPALDPKVPTSIMISLENGSATVPLTMEWVPLNPMSVTNLLIRSGSTVRFGVTTGEYRLLHEGLASDLAPGRDVFASFNRTGMVDVVVTDKKTSKVTRRLRVAVTSFDDVEGKSTACWINKSRLFDTVISTNAVLYPDQMSGVSIGYVVPNSFVTAGRLHQRLTPYHNDRSQPPVGFHLFRGFDLTASEDSSVRLITEYEDGTQLIALDLAMHPVVPGVSVVLDIYAPGVSFADGGVYKELKSSDFSPAGEATVFFIRQGGVMSSACHRLRVYHNGNLVGTR